MLNIPKNDYKEDTRCDEKIVQAICDAFLANHSSNEYHPFDDGTYRPRDAFIKLTGAFCDWRYAEGKKDCVGFTNAEMDMAVEELRKAGYYLYKRYAFGTWLTYFFDKRPYLDPSNKATRVESIPHFS
jgi:hypothetical protein